MGRNRDLQLIAQRREQESRYEGRATAFHDPMDLGYGNSLWMDLAREQSAGILWNGDKQLNSLVNRFGPEMRLGSSLVPHLLRPSGCRFLPAVQTGRWNGSRPYAPPDPARQSNARPRENPLHRANQTVAQQAWQRIRGSAPIYLQRCRSPLKKSRSCAPIWPRKSTGYSSARIEP